MKYLTFVLLLAVTLASCSGGAVYTKEYKMPDAEWTYADSLQFVFPIADTNALYTLYLDIDHSVDYRYQNLYTRIYTRYPSGRRLNDQLSLELADPLGLWQGNCGSSNCKVRIPLQTNAYFNETGSYQITMEQYMRQDSLPGIRSMRLQIVKSGER